jgi:transposase
LDNNIAAKLLNRLLENVQCLCNNRARNVETISFHYSSSNSYRVISKKDQDEAIGRSKGGLSTKIHATVDALGNPTGFHLTGGQACDLDGADVLLPGMAANTVLADKAYDADARVIEPLNQAGKTAVIPPKCNRKEQRSMTSSYTRRAISSKTSFANLSNSVPLQHATIRPRVTSWPLYISLLRRSGLLDQL